MRTAHEQEHSAQKQCSPRQVCGASGASGPRFARNRARRTIGKLSRPHDGMLARVSDAERAHALSHTLDALERRLRFGADHRRRALRE